MVTKEELRDSAEKCLETVKLLRAGAERAGTLSYLNRNLTLAETYARQLADSSSIADEIHCFAQMYWNIGAARGKVEMYGLLQEDEGDDHD